MELLEIQQLAFGPVGGAFMFGLITGGALYGTYIAPKLYESKIDALKIVYDGENAALKRRVVALEEELQPFNDWKEAMAEERMGHP